MASSRDLIDEINVLMTVSSQKIIWLVLNRQRDNPATQYETKIHLKAMYLLAQEILCAEFMPYHELQALRNELENLNNGAAATKTTIIQTPNTTLGFTIPGKTEAKLDHSLSYTSVFSRHKSQRCPAKTPSIRRQERSLIASRISCSSIPVMTPLK